MTHEVDESRREVVKAMGLAFACAACGLLLPACRKIEELVKGADPESPIGVLQARYDLRGMPFDGTTPSGALGFFVTGITPKGTTHGQSVDIYDVDGTTPGTAVDAYKPGRWRAMTWYQGGQAVVTVAA